MLVNHKRKLIILSERSPHVSDGAVYVRLETKHEVAP